jgi:hypothetical protein
LNSAIFIIDRQSFFADHQGSIAMALSADTTNDLTNSITASSARDSLDGSNRTVSHPARQSGGRETSRWDFGPGETRAVDFSNDNLKMLGHGLAENLRHAD